MAATKEYVKRRAQYNIAYTKFLFTTVSPFGPPHKDTIAGWVKNTLTQEGVTSDIFYLIVADHLPAVRPIIQAWILTTY